MKQKSGLRIFSVLLFILFFAVSFFSCSSLSGIFKEPDVSFSSVSIDSINFNFIDFIFYFEIDNPNSVSLELDSYSYNIIVEEKSIIKGVSQTPFIINKESKSMVEIPASVNFAELFETFTGLYSKESAAYTVDALFTFKLPVFGKMTYNAVHNGTFPVLKIPEISIKSFKVLNISPLSAVFELSVAVKNNNKFALSPDSFNYDFSVAGSSWLKGIAKNTADVMPEGESVIKIPVEMNPARIGRDIFDSIFKGDNIDISLTGSMMLRTSYPGFDSAEIPFSLGKKTAVDNK